MIVFLAVFSAVTAFAVFLTERVDRPRRRQIREAQLAGTSHPLA
jgi:hypothetical protein